MAPGTTSAKVLFARRAHERCQGLESLVPESLTHFSFFPPGGWTGVRHAKRLDSELLSLGTVSKSKVPEVEAYIAQQKEHHRRQDFKSEFLELLRMHEIEFDEAELLI
jgi:hypothetical protein